jgi:hypothetical protein
MRRPWPEQAFTSRRSEENGAAFSKPFPANDSERRIDSRRPVIWLSCQQPTLTYHVLEGPHDCLTGDFATNPMDNIQNLRYHPLTESR